MDNKKRTKTRRVLNDFGQFRLGLSMCRSVANAVIDVLESDECTALIKLAKETAVETEANIKTKAESLEQDPSTSKEIKVHED